MARYIDADALIAKWEEDIKHIPNASFRAMMQGAINEVSSAPTADVVEVVRCKDCIYMGTDKCPSQLNDADFYCCQGEGREDG